MTSLYRVRYKKGDFEVEVESSEQNYVDTKMRELLETDFKKPSGDTSGRKRAAKPSRASSRKVVESTSDNGDEVAESTLTEIITSINDADNFKDIEKHVLDQRDRLPRILMCYYFAHKHQSDPALITTHVERITEHFRVRIAASNVAKVIREGASQYLTGDRVRKRGVATNYKINRTGIDAFEKIMRGEKP